MTEAGSRRPPRLVTACLYLGLISAFQVIGVLIELADWSSLDGQARLTRWTDPLVEGGMTRAGAETALRVAFTMVAIIAAAAVVFAVYTALGHAVSRIMLSIVGPVIGLYCVGQGSLIMAIQGVVVFTCLFQLWSSDVRTWFAIKNGRAPQNDVPTGAWPPPGTSPDSTGTLPHGQPTRIEVGPPVQQSRPRAASVWPLIVLVLSSLFAMGCGAYLVVYRVARDEMVRQQLESGANWMNLSEAEIRDGYEQLAVLSWVAIPLCLIAIGASLVLMLRQRRKR
ncbi:hypothetical protein [Aeromicrobium sp.]|uniref:hypothetical protein n=1 Tax=Aeromicrobium sp. TaxID=1871063 RepID=UPI003C515EB1